MTGGSLVWLDGLRQDGRMGCGEGKKKKKHANDGQELERGHIHTHPCTLRGYLRTWPANIKEQINGLKELIS